jgi:vacuolar-type H+-ATPase subunit I/STV1
MNDTPTPAAFAALHDLIALATNPSATRARLEKLQKAIDKASEAEQRLTERTARHDEKVARDREELDERKARLDARALQLSQREAAAEQIIARDRSDRLDRSRPLAEGMTITQEQP